MLANSKNWHNIKKDIVPAQILEYFPKQKKYLIGTPSKGTIGISTKHLLLYLEDNPINMGEWFNLYVKYGESSSVNAILDQEAHWETIGRMRLAQSYKEGHVLKGTIIQKNKMGYVVSFQKRNYYDKKDRLKEIYFTLIMPYIQSQGHLKINEDINFKVSSLDSHQTIIGQVCDKSLLDKYDDQITDGVVELVEYSCAYLNIDQFLKVRCERFDLTCYAGDLNDLLKIGDKIPLHLKAVDGYRLRARSTEDICDLPNRFSLKNIYEGVWSSYKNNILVNNCYLAINFHKLVYFLHEIDSLYKSERFSLTPQNISKTHIQWGLYGMKEKEKKIMDRIESVRGKMVRGFHFWYKHKPYYKDKLLTYKVTGRVISHLYIPKNVSWDTQKPFLLAYSDLYMRKKFIRQVYNDWSLFKIDRIYRSIPILEVPDYIRAYLTNNENSFMIMDDNVQNFKINVKLVSFSLKTGKCIFTT